MPKKFIPILYDLFPRESAIVDETNCLAFALGISRAARKKENYALETGIPIDKAFIKKVRKLGLDTKKFKKIKTEDEQNVSGYIIRVYDFADVRLTDGTVTKDFHLIRREPNGEWVHKPGFGYPPRKVSKEDWEVILERYGDRFVSFAIEV